jgi:hypothetical protein
MVEADTTVYYAMIRRFRPRRIIEIGAGYSTLAAAKAVLANGTGRLEAIDPYPRQFLRDGFPGLDHLEERPVQDIPPDRFRQLEANDILFVDSTHVFKIGSDLHTLFFSVLPFLAPGVLLHFHDVFLPSEYHQTWVRDRHIFYNEQHLLLAFLLFNERFRVLLSTHYLGTRLPGEVMRCFPFLRAPNGGSFWIQA